VVVDTAHPIAWGYDERVPLINRFGPYLNVPSAVEDRVILRYGDADELFLSGLVLNREGLAKRPAVVSLPVGEGQAVLFGFNPLHRYQTHGMFDLVWNAILHWDQL
jgi:trehalose utilization protein